LSHLSRYQKCDWVRVPPCQVGRQRWDEVWVDPPCYGLFLLFPGEKWTYISTFRPTPAAVKVRLEYGNHDFPVVSLEAPVHSPNGVVFFAVAVVFYYSNRGEFLERHPCDFAV
jgi:hypothetical protein